MKSKQRKKKQHKEEVKLRQEIKPKAKKKNLETLKIKEMQKEIEDITFNPSNYL